MLIKASTAITKNGEGDIQALSKPEFSDGSSPSSHSLYFRAQPFSGVSRFFLYWQQDGQNHFDTDDLE